MGVIMRAALLSTAFFIATASVALATPAFVNGIALPGNGLDLSGDTGTPLASRLGYFSDLYYDSNRDEWWAVGDRGPGGGTISYETRVQRFTIDINPVTGAISNFQVAQTVKFTDPNHIVIPVPPNNFNGLAPNPTNALGAALDPEGFVVHPTTGRFLVSDEYGPSLYEFNRDGTLNRVFATPANLIPRSAADVPNFASDAGNTQGKRTNRGFEGLAISPDGKYAYAMLQSAMLDEGAGNGEYARIVKFDTETGQAVAQYAYHMEGSSQGRGISALVALNDTEFLVLERNNRGVGVDSELTPPNKKVFKIDISGASDVTNDVLPATGALPGGKAPVSKTATPFMDLTTDTLAALGNRPPEKMEGLTIGPQIGGQYLIVVGTDNDFSVTQDAGTGIQFDEYFNPSTIERIRCDIGTFDNCTVVNANGSLGGAFVGSTDGFALVPGVLYAYLSTGQDLAGFVEPFAVPSPASLALFVPGLYFLFARIGRKASRKSRRRSGWCMNT
jgi:hypothetical protein